MRRAASFWLAALVIAWGGGSFTTSGDTADDAGDAGAESSDEQPSSPPPRPPAPPEQDACAAAPAAGAILAATDAGPLLVATDGTYVYWAGAQRLERVAIADGGVEL